MPTPILLVEDDDGIAAPLQRALAREDYDVRRVAAGEAAIDQVRDRAPHLVILDLGLPDIDGLEVCRRLRDGGFAAPILILTARGDELDRVVGLDAGADDYLAKPFGLAELLARTRALLRRHGAPASATAATPTSGQAAAPSPGRLSVSLPARRAWAGENELQLSAKEFGILALLAEEPGAVVTRERFMEEVWDEHWFGPTKTLDVTIGRLRQKLETAAAPVAIVAVRGVGFRLEEDDA
ncbi:MAG TPA: response regulator transcription factor [Aquihabitans sp.]|jgi:DNA-binding response OmpR family regulator|nr:response regulator transcription factor [Aquihabitans sp.]